MSAAREAVGITAVVLGVALLIATALVDLPGLRLKRVGMHGPAFADCLLEALATAGEDVAAGAKSRPASRAVSSSTTSAA